MGDEQELCLLHLAWVLRAAIQANKGSRHREAPSSSVTAARGPLGSFLLLTHTPNFGNSLDLSVATSLGCSQDNPRACSYPEFNGGTSNT